MPGSNYHDGLAWQGSLQGLAISQVLGNGAHTGDDVVLQQLHRSHKISSNLLLLCLKPVGNRNCSQMERASYSSNKSKTLEKRVGCMGLLTIVRALVSEKRALRVMFFCAAAASKAALIGTKTVVIAVSTLSAMSRPVICTYNTGLHQGVANFIHEVALGCR